MTRKDYILIARALRQSRLDHNQARTDAVLSVTANLAEEFGHDNPLFDRDHFLAVVRGEKALESRPARASRMVKK